jgi:hypothetical protein
MLTAIGHFPYLVGFCEEFKPLFIFFWHFPRIGDDCGWSDHVLEPMFKIWMPSWFFLVAWSTGQRRYFQLGYLLGSCVISHSRDRVPIGTDLSVRLHLSAVHTLWDAGGCSILSKTGFGC